jgi:hypothetical protein
MKEKVLDQLKTQFRPEFLNRVDSVVVFRSLSVEEIREIVDLMLARVRDQLRAQQMSLEVTQEAKDHIIKLGYDVDYGARPLRRVIQNMIEDPLAEALLMGRFEPGMTIRVDKDEEAGLSIEPSPRRSPSRRAEPVARPRAATSAARAARRACAGKASAAPAAAGTRSSRRPTSSAKATGPLERGPPRRRASPTRGGEAEPASGGRHRRARPRARRRPRPGSLVLLGGEPGHRQVDARAGAVRRLARSADGRRAVRVRRGIAAQLRCGQRAWACRAVAAATHRRPGRDVGRAHRRGGRGGQSGAARGRLDPDADRR